MVSSLDVALPFKYTIREIGSKIEAMVKSLAKYEQNPTYDNVKLIYGIPLTYLTLLMHFS